jgi:UDP-GlcNAc:undecaprenyl-phosphate GlcNAc-1-phosphate transferase
MSPTQLAAVLLAIGGFCFLLALAGTAAVIPLARRVGYVDRPGAHKSHRAPTPYGGGVAIFVAAWLPLTALVAATFLVTPEWVAARLGESFAPYVGGLIQQRGQALAILLGGFALHVMGILDDVRPLGPLPKLAVMLAVALATAWLGQVRVLEAVVGTPLSVAASALWIVVIVNAFNFLDNMDGLSAGVAAICLAVIVACGLLAQQVFVPALGCVFLGAVAGFLVWNFPPARIFMGDAGSLVVGYMLAVTSTMTTYYHTPGPAAPYALAMPLVILAIPLYDFASVITIRISEGRHPMRGDQRHFSHRLVDRGLSRRFAVGTIYLATAATGLAATLLPGADLRATVTVLLVVVLVLAIIAILEAPLRKTS